MKKKSSKYYVPFLLILMFAAPGIAAYILYQHPAWLGGTSVNKGRLLSPPVLASCLDTQKKWRIILWNPQPCGASCLQKLEILAKVRLALGRKLYQVDQWLWLSEASPSLSSSNMQLLKQQNIQVAPISITQQQQLLLDIQQPQIFVANPDNYLILAYLNGVNPDDIYKDLKLLLNISEYKRG